VSYSFISEKISAICDLCFIPRDAAMLASTVLGVVILSVRLSVCLSVTRVLSD